jgi:excisionase family DNA binding protein
MATVYTPEWIPVREAAARLGCDRKTITNRINAGTITGVRVIKIGRVVRLNRADWYAYLDRLAPASQQAA